MNHQQNSATGVWTAVDTADGPMRIYVARPQDPADRAVVVLQEAFGVNDHIQAVTRRLAARGFLALAPDLFHRTGTAELTYSQHTEGMRLIGALGPGEITTDLRAVLDHLAIAERVPVSRTALTGFCFGGRAAFTGATALPGLAAAVVFYGPGIAVGRNAVLDRAKSVDAPLLLHVGAEDPTIPGEQVADIDEALTSAGVSYEQHVYPGAGHAFACDARPDKFCPGPADEAWARTFDFLDTHLPASA
ncbi:dienelactone hydrolase family protein [Streptomyces hokutonensis]|uniref:dienelactone hydrolase family protein n=1 Tax=Streptomyces hokutonensis TaxID=1306990 RepID=UPI003813CF97